MIEPLPIRTSFCAYVVPKVNEIAKRVNALEEMQVKPTGVGKLVPSDSNILLSLNTIAFQRYVIENGAIVSVDLVGVQR